jgi:[ribosomal protein S18]-alanine N-acetyltransferase
MDGRDLPLEFANRVDAPAIAAMSRDLIEAGLGWEYREDRVARLISDPEAATVVARAGTRLAGFAVMSFGAERAHLVLLAVRPAYQRRGLARCMVEWQVESAKVAGMISIHVELRAVNGAARALYESCGFAESLRVPRYYRGKETAIRMLRVLRVPERVPPQWRPPARDYRA